MATTNDVSCKREKLERYPPGHDCRDVALFDLAKSLYERSVQERKIGDLNEAITLFRDALELRPVENEKYDRSASLHYLALCLSYRYDRLGAVNDLEEAISLRRAALELHPPGHPHRDASLHNLACSLRRKFMKQVRISDFQEAIQLAHAALELRPTGHPRRPVTLRQLAFSLSIGYDKLGVVHHLEEAILLGREALKLCPPGHPERGVVLCNLACCLRRAFQQQADIAGLHVTYVRDPTVLTADPTTKIELASSLFELSQHLWDRFQKRAMTTDLDDAISLATYALELRLPLGDVSVAAWAQRLAKGTSSDDPAMLGRAVDNLRALSSYLRTRFRTRHDVVDLNEVITLYRHMLRFCPAGHPNRASSLHVLAHCLADRFREQPTAADLDEAVVLEQEALQLFVRGAPDYHASRRCLTAYIQMKFNPQAAMMSFGALGVTNLDLKQAIRDVAFETLKTMPTRLLHTPTGVLCNRDEQVSHFMDSQQCKQLESLCTTCDWHQQMELVRADISRHFQYVTLSHRWGEGEPSLRDIEGHTIYDMSIKGGLGKLQAFCRVALELDYLWAWSDTCCIDKGSSAEVQETIGSMFSWYRQSALTVVHLSDVPDTGSFRSSEWFRRGWTLQELLAPRNVLFYTETWSLYKNLASSNHKTDFAVLEELERETGIEPRFLTSFSPGLDNSRSRLQWASMRRTTRPEDIAYSLFGIFNFHLPVMYGESAENALGRLLAEIVSQSGDISVLDWVGEPSPFHSCFPAHIVSYQRLPMPPPHPTAEEQPSVTSEELRSFEVLRNVSGSPTTGPAVQPQTSDSYAPSDVYDFHSLSRVPLARFSGRLLTLPCIAYHVTTIQLKGPNLSKPSYTYNVQASGLTPLEIALPVRLEDVTRSQSVLYLVRPWHSKLLGPSAELDAVTEDELVSALGRPFNAFLLTRLPHNEYKRIASSTLITVQPMDRASILNSRISIFNVV